MVGVLTEYYHLDLVERSELEGPEDLAPGRVDGLALSLFPMQERDKLCKVSFVELTLQSLFPASFDPNVQR